MYMKDVTSQPLPKQINEPIIGLGSGPWHETKEIPNASFLEPYTPQFQGPRQQSNNEIPNASF
jgi:hypothetical protein